MEEECEKLNLILGPSMSDPLLGFEVGDFPPWYLSYRFPLPLSPPPPSPSPERLGLVAGRFVAELSAPNLNPTLPLILDVYNVPLREIWLAGNMV